MLARSAPLADPVADRTSQPKGRAGHRVPHQPPAHPHPLTADLAAIGAIYRYDTGTWWHIPLIVWKATERVREGCSLALPRMLNGHKEGAIVWREGWPAYFAAWQATHEHLRHTPLWTLDFHNVDSIVLLDSARLTIGGDPQTACIVEGNVIGARHPARSFVPLIGGIVTGVVQVAAGNE